MYVWLEQSEVLQIKTKKYTVFMNNRDKDQTTAWYEQIKKRTIKASAEITGKMDHRSDLLVAFTMRGAIVIYPTIFSNIIKNVYKVCSFYKKCDICC